MIKSLFKWIWWLGMACVPYGLLVVERRYSAQIGCPAHGYCYQPGFELLGPLDLLVKGTTAGIWPVCAWFLLVAPVLAMRATARRA